MPLLVPEVNPGSPEADSRRSSRNRGWKGMIVTNPNCSTVVLTMALAPLKQFGIRARDRHDDAGRLRRGLSGVASMDIVGNVDSVTSGAKKRKCSRRPRRSSAVSLTDAFAAGRAR